MKSKKVKYKLELQEKLKHLEAELRTGGGATLDELYDVALAAENDLQDIRNKIDWIFGYFDWKDYLTAPKPSKSGEQDNESK